MNYQEVHGDLFSVLETHVLAHYVSADLALGTGIAKEFIRRFPQMKPTLKQQYHPTIGDALPYRDLDLHEDYIDIALNEKMVGNPLISVLYQLIVAF